MREHKKNRIIVKKYTLFYAIVHEELEKKGASIIILYNFMLFRNIFLDNQAIGK
jgi:hypothetical protein